MKKFLILATVLAALGAQAAQEHVSRSFFGGTVRALSVLNGAGATNYVDVVDPTNKVAVVYTNTAGAGATAAVGSFTPLLGQVDLPQLPSNPLLGLAFAATATNVTHDIYAANSILFVRLIGTNAAANSAVNFRFIPVPDGTTADTASGSVWTIGVTANGTTAVTVRTNLPLHLWPGVKSIRLQDVTNADTDAAARVWITNCSLEGSDSR